MDKKNFKYRYYSLIAVSLFLILINSCVTVYDTINNRNYADLYNPGQRTMHPEYFIYQKSADDVRLYFRFFPKEFAYSVLGIDTVPTANVSLFFRVTNSYSSVEIIDSLTSTFRLKSPPHKQFLGYVPVRLSKQGRYIIEIFLSDNLSGNIVSTVLDYDYSHTNGASNFMFISKFGNPYFYNWFSPVDTFRIKHELNNLQDVRVTYYKPDTILPLPPDIQKDISLTLVPVDSSWIVKGIDTAVFSFKNKGTYYFSEPGSLKGKVFSCYNKSYPYVKTPIELLKPIAYIASSRELKKIKKHTTPKVAVDSFWLGIANNVDKARELIRVYYNRVQLANYYFADYRQGWQTDRGMIYVICGAPSYIQKTDTGEKWVYGQHANEITSFFFYREKHPVFGDVFILERSDLYARMWYSAISTWRDGRVFSLNP